MSVELVLKLKASLTKGAFARPIERPTFDVSLYRPNRIDTQEPHTRDELYDCLRLRKIPVQRPYRGIWSRRRFLRPARIKHQFDAFSKDFATWVIFFGARPSN